MRERLPLLAVAVGALGVAGVKAWKAGLDHLSVALLSAGLVVLGAWIATEIQHYRKDDR